MTTDATAIDPILEACAAGHQTLLVTGRALSDLHADERGEVRPLQHTLVRQAKEKFGMATLEVDLALGPRWNWEGFTDEERKSFEQRIQAGQNVLEHGIRAGGDYKSPPHERAYLMLAALLQSIRRTTPIPPLLILWAFGEDLAPSTEHGGASDWIIQIAEVLQLLGADYQRRLHPFLLVVTGDQERMDKRVVNCLQPIVLSQPDRDEKLKFIESLRRIPKLSQAVYEQGLDDLTVANLTARTPNRSLEESFFESSRTTRPITHLQLIERKRADVVCLSEGTLSLLDTDRVRKTKLAGRTVEKPLALLTQWASGLKNGNSNTPTSVILAGAPASAKTDLALITALKSQVPAYRLVSPKGSLVGQCEKLVRCQFRTFKDLSPAFGVIDEITEAFPMQRNSMNLDSGASDAVTAEMLSALSDSSRAGRTLLIATTNCPWRVGSAMASRFVYLPVLSAIAEDFPDILVSIAENLMPTIELSSQIGDIQEAARLFHAKGATPRTMRTLISCMLACDEEPASSQMILHAAQACSPQDPRDRLSSEYADLFAIRVCSNLKSMPWHGRIAHYPLPAYLRGIVSESDGGIDKDRLNRRIEELKPHVNV